MFSNYKKYGIIFKVKGMKKLFSNLKKMVNLMDKPLLIVTILFFLFGLLNIVTASSREAVVRYEVSTYYYFFKQLQMLIIGFTISLIIINLKTKYYKNLIIWIYLIVLGLVILLFPFGKEINGATNWLPIPGIGTIQPSEFAKPVSIVLISIVFEQYYRLFRSDNKKRYNKIGILLLIFLLIPALTFIQKDLGSSLIMLAIFGVMFLASPIKRIDKLRTIALIFMLGVIGISIIILKQGYLLSEAQMSRFDFFNPCSKYETTGYQVCNGFIALNDGGLFGLGIGNSKQKYSYIPEPHTDSIFAIIGEEYGVIKCSFVFLAYIFVIFRILKIATNTNTIRGRYICLGVATYIFAHILINLGGLFGLIPLTGVPLPFLSYGGTYAISLMCSLAVVQRFHIEKKLEKFKFNH